MGLLDFDGVDSLVPHGYVPRQVVAPVTDLAGRYGAGGGTPAPRPAIADLSDQEVAEWQDWSEQALDDSSAAHAALRELPDLEARAGRAVASGDADAALAVASRVDEIVDRFGDLLTPWGNLSGGGSEGASVSARVRQATTGQYRYEWGVRAANGSVRSLAELLDENSEESKARRAHKASQDLDAPESVARAVVDRDDPKHAVYRRFSSLLGKGAAPGADPVAALHERDRRTAFFKSVQRLDTRMGDRFASPSEMGEFVAAFDSNMNAKGLTAAESVFMDAADAFLRQKDGGYSADEFMQRFKASVDALSGPQAGGPDRKPGDPSKEQSLRERMSVLEAQDLMSAFVREAGRLGVEGDVTSGKYRDAMASAALASRRLGELYGIDLRAGGKGDASSSIAQLALSRLNVPGSDGGSLASAVDEVTSRLSTLASGPTRELVRVKQGQRGDISGQMEDGANPYLQTELSAMRKAGAALWKAVSDNGGNVELTMARLAEPGQTRDSVVSAIASGLAPRLGGRLAAAVAGDLVGNMVGDEKGPKMTVEESLRRRAALPKPGPESVPEEKRLSPQDGFDDSDIALLARGEAVASKKVDEKQLRDAQRQLAVMIQERKGKGKGKDKNKNKNVRYHRAVGELYSKLTGDTDELVTSGLLGKLAGASDFGDADGADKVRASVDRLVAEVKDVNRPESLRAEALAKLMIIGASGAMLTEVGEPGPFISSDFEPPPGSVRTRDRWPASRWLAIREAAKTMGLGLPSTQLAYVQTGFQSSLLLLKQIAPSIDESNLVRSGLVNLSGTGPVWDEKNMLRVNQTTSYSDPLKNDGRSEPNLSDEQRAARRALATFETKDTAVGAASARYREHLLSQGFFGDSLAMTEASGASAFADAYRNGGVAGVDRQLAKLTALKRYFLPSWKATASDDGSGKKSVSYVMSPTQVVPADMLTPEGWKAQKRIAAEQYKRMTGQDVPEGLFDQLQTTAPATFRDMMALQRAFAQIDRRKQKPDEE